MVPYGHGSQPYDGVVAVDDELDAIELEASELGTEEELDASELDGADELGADELDGA